MKYLIVNADDFGARPGVNRGILEAHRRGIVTSASLLVDAPSSADAAHLSRDARALSVGLHAELDLGHGWDGPGPEAESRCRSELERQLARFEELVGCPATHLDSHHNVHRHPRLLSGFLAVATAHRLPLREHSPVRYFSRFYGQWGGESHPEQVGVESLVRLLETRIDVGITELSCHPGYVDPDPGSGYSAEREVELRTLCDPRVRSALDRLGITLVSYHALERLVST